MGIAEPITTMGVVGVSYPEPAHFRNMGMIRGHGRVLQGAENSWDLGRRLVHAGRYAK
jgi:hypothetical protein